MRRTTRSGFSGALATALLFVALAAGCSEARTIADRRVECTSWAPGPTAYLAGGAGVVAGPVLSAFVGRDGTHLLYRANDGRLVVRRTATGDERELLLADDVSVFPGTVDAGRFVGFSHRSRDNYEEYFVVDVESCTSRDLYVYVSTADPIIGYSRMTTVSLAGDRLFYAISRGSLTPGDEFLLDLPSRGSQPVEADAHVVYASSLEGDRVVWLQRGSDGSYALGKWTLADGALQEFAVPVAASPTQLSASGERAVWIDHRDLTGVKNEHVYVLDLATGVEARVTADPGRQIDPSVLGHLVAWADDRTGRFEIHVADLEAGTEQVMPASSQFERWPTLTTAGLFWIGTGPNGSVVHFEPAIRP